MVKASFGVALAGLIMVTGSAFADEFHFSSPGGTIWNGVYVSPYLARDNTQNRDLTIYCDDWNTDFSGNPTWSANVYQLTPANSDQFKYSNATEIYNVTLLGGQLTPVLDTTSTQFQRYLEVAYLDEKLEQELKSNDTAEQIELAAAQWTLFVDTAHVNPLIDAINNSGYGTAVFDELTEAHAAVANGSFNGADWRVMVPQGQNSNSQQMQEFLYDTPEPSAVILLGTVAGLLGLSKLRRKRQV